MILVKNKTTRKRQSDILRAVTELLAAAGEMLITGRVIKDNDGSETGKDGPKT